MSELEFAPAPEPPSPEAQAAAAVLVSHLTKQQTSEPLYLAETVVILLAYALTRLEPQPDGRLLPRGRKAPKAPPGDKARAQVLARVSAPQAGAPISWDQTLVIGLTLLERFVRQGK